MPKHVTVGSITKCKLCSNDIFVGFVRNKADKSHNSDRIDRYTMHFYCS